ncbi:unnamed protein product [Cunninghamella blakesleeana]
MSNAIARSFTDKYTPLIHHVINKLQDPLVNIIQQTEIPVQLSSAMYNDTITSMLTKNVLDRIQQFQDNITTGLEANIYSVMFMEQDPFKGDCNHPSRLSRNKPPPGDFWTLKECEDMDYICGNPPSICHFLDIIKKRIIERMKILLQKPVQFQGNTFRSIGQDTKQTIQGLMVKYGAGSLLRDQSVFGYMNNIIRDTLNEFEKWVQTDIENLCMDPDHELYCGGWDNDIKYEILQYP